MTIPMKKMHASASLAEDMRADVSVRNFQLINDEPTEVGGTNLGPTPTETALQALISCASMVVRVASKTHGIPVTSVETNAEADFDLRGVMFQEVVDLPYRKIALSFRVTGVTGEDELTPIKAAIRDFCPVHKLFSQAGTEITESWEIVAA